MEGGNKSSIDLESPLDISTSDMLVPVMNPTFQHNWQRYQGKFLPNSLRFEKNGWAAGWNVYNFEYNSFRVQLADNVWVRLGKLNDYVKILYIYDSKDSYKVLAKYYVIQNTLLISGEGSVTGQTIKGSLNNKSFILNLDDFSITEGFTVSHYTLNNKTEVVKVIDTKESFDVEFDLLTGTSLSGDCILDCKYISFSNNVHSWGSYTYDLSTGTISTPEGLEVVPMLSDKNLLTFDYQYIANDETASISYTFDTYYYKFTSIIFKDNSKDYMIIGDTPSERLKFNYYDAYSKKTNLVANDENGVVIDWQLPLWAVVDVSITNDSSEFTASCKCDNTDGFNIAIRDQDDNAYAGYNIEGKPAVKGIKVNWTNAYSTAYDGEQDISFSPYSIHTFTYELIKDVMARYIYQCHLRLKSSQIGRIASIHPEYRFNQFLYKNILFCPDTWSPSKITGIPNTDVWYLNTKKYENLREKNTTLMEQYLGNVYTFGTFTYNPVNLFELNNPFDWTDDTNYVYIMRDISNILSVKNKGEADNIVVGDDEDFLKYPSSLDFIAKLTGTTIEYNKDQEYVTYAQAYTNGIYTYGTYENIEDISSNIPEEWVFEKVPKFNVELDSGEHIEGVYWTDGGTYITDFSDFVTRVLGTYDDSIDPDNVKVTLNDNYDRTRNVHMYSPVYDFDFYGTDETDLTEDEIKAKEAFEALWEKWYPTLQSPNSKFNDNLRDSTYLDFVNIKRVNRTPAEDRLGISYSVPGVNLTHDKVPDVLTQAHFKIVTNSASAKAFIDQAIYSHYHVYNYGWGIDDRILYTDSYSSSTNTFLPFNNNIDLILNEDSFNTNNFDVTCGIIHHSVDKASEYSLINESSIGSLTFPGGSITLPSYYGNIAAVYVAKRTVTFNSSSKSFNISDSSIQAQATPTNIKLGINYDSDWNPVEASEGNWIKHLILEYSNGILKINNAELNDNIQAVTSYYSMVDANKGVKFAWPIWGHSATRLTYPKLVAQSSIYNSDTFVLESVPSNKLTDTALVYWDRGDTDKSILLFEVIEDSKNPDDFQQSGSLTLGLSALADDSCLYYAEKVIERTTSGTSEVIYGAYIPGIAFGDMTDNSGHMSVILTNYPKLKLEWVPVSYNVPINATVSYLPLNSKNSLHKFFSTGYKQLVFTVELDEFDVATLSRGMTLIIGDVRVAFMYNVQRQRTELLSDTTEIYSDTNARVTLTDISGKKEVATVSMEVSLEFIDNKARFTKLLTQGLSLESVDKTLVYIKVGDVIVVYNSAQQSIVSPKSLNTVTVITNGVNVQLSADYSKAYNVSIKNVTDNKYNFIYSGNNYTVDLSLFNDKVNTVNVISTDIRDCKTKVIDKIDTDSQYQLVKQQWNTTTAVENFWWINDKYILELDSTNFILKRKTEELDDWNGDRFEIVGKYLRADYTYDDSDKYFVTSCYKADYDAMLVVISANENKLKVCLYDVCDDMSEFAEFYLYVSNKEIGSRLNETTINDNMAVLNTYSVFNINYILANAEFSSTIVDSRLLLGIHVSKNFDQWTVMFNLKDKSVEKVVQGYGYVGLKGDLTGGQIPSDYMDVNVGFNDTVQSLSVLNSVTTHDIDNLDAAYEADINKLNEISAKVVGTAERQWYIKRKLYGIVSHLTYSNGQFTKQILPITNNYSASFMSPSWASSIVGDNMVQATSFSSLVEFPNGADTVWNTLMNIAGNPQLYSIAPRYAMIAYINMTLGQYAYVHYNSSKSMPEKEPELLSKTASDMQKNLTDPVSSSDYVFDKQKFTQNLDTSLDVSQSLVLALLVAFGNSINDTTNEKLSVNEEIAQTSIDSFGRRFETHATENISDMLASNIVTKTRNMTGINGAVTGLKSLDMFYSTCNEQEVLAGPGFVEHRFVADCVAQSSTTLQVEGAVYQFYWSLAKLSLFQLEKQIQLLKIAADNLSELAEDWAAATGPCAVNYGAAIATGFTASAIGLRYTAVVQEKVAEFLQDILSCLTKQGLTSHRDGSVSRHSLSVEGKHKYGEKNETFMWPCWGIQAGGLKYTDEWVEAGVKNTPWSLKLESRLFYTTARFNYVTMLPMSYTIPRHSSATGSKSDFYRVGSPDITDDSGSMDREACVYRAAAMSGKVPYYQATCYGNSMERTLPDDMAKVEGVKNILPAQPFKNENIGVAEPVFPPSMFQDYKIDENWDLGMCCTYGLTQWITIKDTKITSCAPSNMVVTNDFCGVATPYSAVEVKRGLSKEYMRPWAITPNVLAFNSTGLNSILDNKLYHAFDGVSYRLIDWVGTPGLNKQKQTFWYAFQVNDRFKRSNKFPANELLGNFDSEPVQAIATIDKLWSKVTIAAEEKGLEGGTIGEDKDATRWAIPIFTEPVTTLPAAVKTLTAMPLNVYDGVTALTTNLSNNQTAYKAPLSVDFTIGKNVYRQTEEYICSVQTQGAVDVVTELVPSLGLIYIGSTPTEAYFYSNATRYYYMFTGSNLTKMDMMERFRSIQKGYWDFVNQEVIMPCLMTFKRLNVEVEDKDTETDNVIVPVLSKGRVSGEVIPPLTTIFNDRSWYRAVSLPAGFAYQGPNRVIVNRTVFCEYMLDSLKDNLGKWSKMGREKYTTKRTYPEVYDTVDKDVTEGVDGWTYNPFVLVTSALGNDEDTDCIFEWVIAFCWPIEMDLIYGVDNYAVVNVTAETMTPGGKVKSRPTHIFLTKEQFTRTGNYGYYSFRFQSKNGAGNRERLHIWSDQYIAISRLDCEVKPVTSRRHEPLVQQLDVQRLKEL